MSFSGAASARFFEYLFDGVMRDRIAVLQLDRFVSQETERPTGVTCGRSGTSERGNLSALCAVNPDGSPGTWLVEQGHVKACAQVTPLDVEDGLERNLQQGGNLVRVLAAMQEVKSASAGLRSGSRCPATDDGCQRAKFVFA